MNNRVNHCTFFQSVPPTSRRGLSFLEIIGCTVAIAGGIWIGAQYTGLDLRQAWNLGSEKAGIESIKFSMPEEEQLEEIPTDERSLEAVAEELLGSDTDTSEKVMTDLETSSSTPTRAVTEEIAALEKRLAKLSGKVQKKKTQKKRSTNTKSIGMRTLKYWKTLNAIMEKEEGMERDLATLPKILFLGGAKDPQVDLRTRLGKEVEVVEAKSGLRALAQIARGSFTGVYVSSEFLTELVRVGKLLQNTKILESMPDGGKAVAMEE